MAPYKNYDTDGERMQRPDKSPYSRKDRRKKRNPWPSEDKFDTIPEHAVPDWLRQYLADMYVWSSRVRADILHLEKHTTHPPGDPGDPPAGPWGPPK